MDVRGVMHSVNSRVEHGLTIGPPSFCSRGFRYRRSVKRIFVHSMTSKMCYKVFYSIMLVRLLILTNEKKLVVYSLNFNLVELAVYERLCLCIAGDEHWKEKLLI